MTAHDQSERTGTMQPTSDELEADEQAAIDLALNDCQMWDNLPESVKGHYRKLAAEDDEAPV